MFNLKNFIQVPNEALLECSTITDMTGKVYFGGPKEELALQKVLERK